MSSMSRQLIVVSILGLVAVNVLADSLPSPRSWVSKRLSDVVGTATKTNLATEREKLVNELCEVRKSRSAPTVHTRRKREAPREDGRAVVTEERTEKLPGNKTEEVVVTERTEKLPSNATVKKTVERHVVKGADGKATGNETVIEKETRTDISPSNATVTTTVKEHKVVGGEKGEEEKKETVTEKEVEKAGKPEKEVVKAGKPEKEVETGEKPEPVKLPVNATVKKTSVERKVLKNTSKDGEPQKEIVIEMKTRIERTKATETPTLGIVNASVLDEKAGPTKIVVTKKKIETLPGNETKEVVVKEKAEKLPSNETIKKTVVELKVTKDTGKDSDRPQQETIILKEVEVQIMNPTAEAKAAGKDKKQEYREKLQNIKRQVEEVKKQIKDEEIKAAKVDASPETCVEEQ